MDEIALGRSLPRSWHATYASRSCVLIANNNAQIPVKIQPLCAGFSRCTCYILDNSFCPRTARVLYRVILTHRCRKQRTRSCFPAQNVKLSSQSVLRAHEMQSLPQGGFSALPLTRYDEATSSNGFSGHYSPAPRIPQFRNGKKK